MCNSIKFTIKHWSESCCVLGMSRCWEYSGEKQKVPSPKVSSLTRKQTPDKQQVLTEETVRKQGTSFDSSQRVSLLPPLPLQDLPLGQKETCSPNRGPWGLSVELASGHLYGFTLSRPHWACASVWARRRVLLKVHLCGLFPASIAVAHFSMKASAHNPFVRRSSQKAPPKATLPPSTAILLLISPHSSF